MKCDKLTPNKLVTILLVLLIYMFSGCIESEVNKDLQEAQQLYRVLINTTDCELVEISDFTKENGKRKSATFKLVGCRISEFDIEAERINAILKDSIEYFCDIKLVTYEFINNQNSNIVKYYHCNSI